MRKRSAAEAVVDPKESVARLYAALPPKLEAANLVFDTANRAVSKTGEEGQFSLRPKEYDTLLYLAVCASLGHLAHKMRLFDHLYVDVDLPPGDKVIDVFICNIRRCLEKEEAQCHIQTVHHVGYRLKEGPAPVK